MSYLGYISELYADSASFRALCLVLLVGVAGATTALLLHLKSRRARARQPRRGMVD